MPLFYAILLGRVLWDWLFWHDRHSIKEVALSVGMLFNLVPGKSDGIVWASWTIGAEMLFYLIFPLVIKAAATRLRLSLCFVGSLAIAALFYWIVQHSHLSTANRTEFFATGLLSHLPAFVLGIVAYTIFASRRFREARVSMMWIGSLLIFAALALHLAFAYRGMYFGIIGADWSAPACMLLVLGLTLNPIKLIVNPITKFYGDISYSVYLNHPIVVMIMRPVYLMIYRHVSSSGTALLVCVVATFAVLTPWAWLTYQLIEQPGRRFGSRLIRSMGKSRIPIAP